jgi:hypothetical protein
MNYPVSTQSSGTSYKFIIRVGLLVLLFFFIAFFIFEIISFFKLFEVKMVISPGVSLLK